MNMIHSSHFGVAILAAGKSERMGHPKLLMNLGSKTVLQRITDNPFLSRPNVVPLLILGHQAEEIQKQISVPFPSIVNTRYEQGRTTSIQCAIRSFPREVDGMFIWPVDCPLVPSEVLEALCDAFQNPHSILIPSCRYKRGHPPLIGSAYFDEILSMTANQSLRELYQSHPNRVCHVSVNSDTILHNLNTPDDIQAILERYDFM